MTARNEDFLFAQEAQNLGYVSEEQVEEGFLLQTRMSEDLKIDERLAVILVKRGWLADEQARRVYGIIEPEGARSQIEGYRLVQKIGRGAMGTVYKAIHKGLHRVVAIKILRRDLVADKTQIERLKREAQLLADLDHPNIVRAFDAGESNGFPYLVMEYVEGDTLREYIAKSGTLGDEEALRITRAMADALEKARRMGVVHRDVKPGNILISKSGTPKLMDLGLAKGPLDPGLTQHGATVGTPQFMSPEQAESPDKADTRSDIYSLGASLYAMVTGRPPFEGSTLAEIIMKVMSQQPVPPRVRNVEVSPEVSHLIERMMLKDASLRYATPAHVIADIDMIRGGQSIIPRGFQGNWEAYLLRKRFLSWRRRIVVGLAAALVLGVGSYVYVTQMTKIEKRKEVAQLVIDMRELPAVNEATSLGELQEWKRKSAAMFERIRQIESSHPGSLATDNNLETKVDEYAEAARVMLRFEGLRAGIKEKMSSQQFARAVQMHRSAAEALQHVSPVVDRYNALRTEITQASDKALELARKKVLNQSSTTLPSFAKKWSDYSALFSGPWATTPRLTQARAAADVAAEKAGKIAEVIRAFEAEFAPAEVDRRVRALEFYDLKRHVSERRAAAARDVQAHLHAWPKALPAPPVLDPGDIGAFALAQAEKRIDSAVEAYWTEFFDSLAALPLAERVERLEAFEVAIDRGNHYPEIAAVLPTLVQQVKATIATRGKAAKDAFEGALQLVLKAVHAGDAGKIEKRVDAELASGGPLNDALRGKLRELRIAGTVLRAIQDGALTYLSKVAREKQTLRDVALRAEAGADAVVHKSLRVTAVDMAARTVSVRVTRPGSSRKEEVILPIDGFDLQRVFSWAGQGGATLPASASAFVEFAVLAPARDVPGTDLRKLGREYGRVAQLFKTAKVAGWATLLDQLTRELEELQLDREDQAAAIRFVIQQADASPKGKFKVVAERYEQLADPAGRLRYTDVFDINAADLAKTYARAQDELKRQELLRLFEGGVGITELGGGRHSFLFDFDDLGQLRNFERGFARAVATKKTVTPDELMRSRELHLLPRVKGVLRDRPLSLRTFFDPNEKIVLQVRLRAPRAGSLLAFDIDGVQIAIASADPNWWRRRFPEGTPLVDDEEKLPDFDFYGLGRGIAFHDGKDFGSGFPHGNWSWSPRSAGRFFKRWKDPAYLLKHRADLFAFEPAKTYTVRIVRDRGQMLLYVNDELIVQKTKAKWAQRGGSSDSNRRIRQGSGRIQILTWTHLVIDDLVLEGKVSERWKQLRRAKLEANK